MSEQAKAIRTTLSELLVAEGFTAMSRDVLEEYEPKMIQRYARIVVKNAPASKRPLITQLLQKLKLLPATVAA